MKGHRKLCASLVSVLVLSVLCAAGAWSPAACADPVPPFGWAASTLEDGINLSQVAILGPRDVYVAGTVPGATVNGRVCRFDGDSWTTMRSVPGRYLYAVAALDASHVWTAGQAGLIQFYDGTSWTDQSVATPHTVNSLYALDQHHVWAVDDWGNIFFYNGTSWSTSTPLPGRGLKGVFALDAKHAWAVGLQGTILAWDGNVWLNQSVGGANTLWAVSGLDSNCVWAAGDNGTVRYFNGYSWTDSGVGGTDDFHGIAALDVNHVFAASVSGKVYFWDGSSWQMMQTTAASELWSIGAQDTDHVYACGDSGTFLHGYSMLEARNTTYYFAEGTCRPAFDPYLCIQNPDGMSDAEVRITYMLGNGSSASQSLRVPKSSRATVAVKGKLGSGDDAAHDFSAKVECTNGVAIIAERPMYFSYRSAKGVSITGGSDVIGALQPRPTFYFAEGTCRPDFDPYICILNPGAADAGVKIVYMLGDGTSKDSTFTVRAHSRKTIAVKDRLGSGDDAAHDFSAKVQTTDGSGIVAERPMYFSYTSMRGVTITGGHDVVGAATPAGNFYFAEGTCRPDFDPYICIQNPGATAANVRITYMKGDGSNTVQALSVPAFSRQTVVVKTVLGSADDAAHDFSARVETLNGTRVIAERPMYFRYYGSLGTEVTGGHDVIGAQYPAGAFYFAEGTCRPTFDAYLCIQNPTATDVPVHVTYMRGDGSMVDRDLNVPRNSRHTVVVKDVLGSGDDAAHDFSVKVFSTSLNYDDIIVERPMYFDYRSSAGTYLTGGHDVVGYSP